MCRFVRARHGFTLIELSVVVVILGLMMAGIVSALTQNIRQDKLAELKIKMDTIEQAILAYTRSSGNYALPCPAIQTYATTVSSFGVAVASGCASLSLLGAASGAGAVPVRSIGLPDEYAFDPWGNQFTYVADLSAATTNAFGKQSVKDTSVGTIALTDTAGNSLNTSLMSVVMVLISHGPDGFGAYTRSGSRKAGYSSNTYQQANSICSNAACAAISYPTSFALGTATQSSADSEDNFDDTVRYYDRRFFLLSGDISVKN